MQLWPHQFEAIATCAEAQKRGSSRVLVQVPPGTGKTEIAARVAVSWCVARPFGRVLICVSSAPVLKQFRRRLVQLTRLPVDVDWASHHASRQSRIVIATQQSLWGRLDSYSRDTLLIYDECHHGNLDAPENLRLARSFRHILGLSATPWSRGCLDLFADSARVTLPLFVAEREGLVAPHDRLPWQAPTGPLGLAFCGTNRECERSSQQSPGSTWIGVQVPEPEIARRIARWRAGSSPVLYANRMLLEGFDEPRCDKVWLDKDTDSQIMLVQMAGRALRYRPGKRARIYSASPAIQEALATALQRCNEPVLKLV